MSGPVCGEEIGLKIEECDFPDDLLYDVERNLWVRTENGTARIGVSTILVWISGVLSSVTLKPTGSQVSLGQVIGSVEGPRHFDVVRTPISGTIVSTNSLLPNEPRILTKDPYGAGWIAEIRPSKRSELNQLIGLPAAKDPLRNRVNELRVHCFAEFPDQEMFEIGVECSAVLLRLNEFLEKSDKGIVIHIVSDDNSAQVEMERWSEQTGHQVLDFRKEGNLYHFIVKKIR